MGASHDTSGRYVRQTILAEVGEAGQARIAAAHVVVHARGLEGDVACRYARAAGFGDVRVDEVAPEPARAPFDAYDDHARAAAAGAYRALVLFRDAIGVSVKPR